jgi:outer membrane protein
MKQLHLILITIFLLQFDRLPAIATSDYDHSLSLAELVNIALENNPATKQAWWNANRAASAVGNAKSSYYPDITYRTSVMNGRDFKFINGPDTSYTIVGADLFLNMLLVDFGEREANVNVAKSALIAANWQLDWSVQKVMVQVLENAYSTMLAQEELNAAEISLNEAEKMLNAAKELNRVGLTPITDVYTTQATYSQIKMDLARQKASLAIHRGKLATSLGLPANSCIKVACPEISLCQQIEQVDTLVAIALEQRADLMAKQARLQEAEFNQKRIKTSYYPKLTLNTRGGYNKYIDHNQRRHKKNQDNESSSHSGQYQIALNFDVPLFNGFESMYQNRMAYADTQITNQELMELQIDISLEVLTYSRTLQAAQEMIPDAEMNLNNSIKAYEGVLEKYKAGKEGITELSWAQRQLAAARVRYIEVKTKLLVSIANLAFATGTLAPYMEASCQENT